MNAVVDEIGASPSDPSIAGAARRVLKRIEW
jgi:hypothetical protein